MRTSREQKGQFGSCEGPAGPGPAGAWPEGAWPAGAGPPRALSGPRVRFFRFTRERRRTAVGGLDSGTAVALIEELFAV